MTKRDYSWEEFNEIFKVNSPSNKGVDEINSLGRNCIYGTLEITLNHPRNKKFCQLDNSAQRNLYKLWFDKATTYLIRKYDFVTGSKFVYEDSTIGIHLHGSITIDLGKVKGNVYGLVEEVFKELLIGIPVGKNSVNSFAKATRFHNIPKLVCPAVCVDFNYIERAAGWDNYINKYSNLNKMT